ncbi:hypothetical protein [Phenylobacterium sp.]|uniref:hypothetical protein n=1 Tax=Phenylobacterium sp. TaxID=1871053 RepID=UPI0025D7FAB8|nr:hypothetical protein [Phenylobacterium sp.]
MTASHLRPLAIYGGLSLVAVAMGCAVAAASGVPAGAWLRSPVAWCVGAVAAAGLAVRAGPRASSALLALTPLGLVASLLNAGQQGVHRWIDAGPLHLNVAQVLLPAAIVALAGQSRSWRWLIAALIMALLIAQPDASQATAFGGALFALLAVSPLTRGARLAGMAATGVAIAASWLRPDPLGPVPEVEEIMRLAAELSPLAAVAAWMALIAAVGSPALMKTAGDGGASRALCAYAVLSALMPLIGPFPVPLVGMAMSPVLGLWLGVGLLAARARLSTSTPAASGG